MASATIEGHGGAGGDMRGAGDMGGDDARDVVAGLRAHLLGREARVPTSALGRLWSTGRSALGLAGVSDVIEEARTAFLEECDLLVHLRRDSLKVRRASRRR